MSEPSRLKHASRLWLKAALIASPLVAFAAAPLWADEYDGRPTYTHPNETAAQLDPVPEIGFGCRFGDCYTPHPGPHGPPAVGLPPILGQVTLLVDCGARHDEPMGGPHEGPRRERHGEHHEGAHGGVFASVDEAVEFAPPNATIMILPPGQGRTCVETVHISKPVTLTTYGSSERAVIQSEDGQPCLVADLPLGDALVIDGVRFIARSKDQPCVAVEAGRVVMRNSSVDARGSAWAFNVRESAELRIESSRVETDESAVHARRARVDIANLDIDIDGRDRPATFNIDRADCTDRGGGTIHGSVGLALECSEGSVEGLSIIGGAIGVVASAGTRGLRFTDAKITKAETGVLLLPGQLGTVSLERPVISRAAHGIVVAPGAESEITGAVVTDSRLSGISVFGAAALISGNKIVGAVDGIELLSEATFPPLIDSLVQPPTPDAVRWIPRSGGSLDGPVVENNLIANVRHSGVRIDARAGGEMRPLFGRLIGNTIYAPGHAVCIDDQHNDDPVRVRANICNRDWLPWPF